MNASSVTSEHAVTQAEGRSTLARKGQVLALFAVMIVVLLAITALVIDTSRVWMTRRDLQNSVDSAALAGAWALPDDTASALSIACEYGTVLNYVTDMSGVDCGGKANVTIEEAVFPTVTVPNGKITVTASRPLLPSFPGLGWPTITVQAKATAVIGSLEILCVFPLFQTQDLLEAAGAWGSGEDGNFIEFNVPVIMKTTANDNNSGNFLALQSPDGPGWNNWRNTVGSPGGCFPDTTGTADTQTGNGQGPLDQGLEDRAALWNDPTSPGYCPDTHPTLDPSGLAVHPSSGEGLTPENCYRLVQIPLLVGTLEDFQGNQRNVPIRGFINFYISNWCGQNSDPSKGSGSDSQHCAAPPPAPDGTQLAELKYGELWGYYLKYEAVTDRPINPYDGLGTKVVVLID